MSYPPPQGNPNYYGGPPGGQLGYRPLPGPQGQYPPQQGGYPPQRPPQGAYPPQQGAYGMPPSGPYPPPQVAFGGPPPGQYPPQQQGAYGMQQQYPPQQAAFGGQPPQVPYVAFPTQIAPPSPGYDPRAAAQGDASRDADALRGAMKGFGTNEGVLIQVLSKPDPLQMTLLRNTYATRIQRNLEHDISSETSSYFKETLVALVRGPLMQDVHTVHKAIKGAGTKESLLNDVLLDRSNADMRAIKQAYHQTFNRTLEADVKGDLSMKTERLFGMVISANRAEEFSSIIPQELERDISELHRATEGKVGTDQITVCSILSSRSDGQLRAIAAQYSQRYHTTLPDVIKKEFSGHMKDALLLMVNRALDRAMTDAVQLEESMAGMGTKDCLLLNRVVRCHWDRAHMEQVKKAYAYRYKKDLIARVHGETSGDFRKLLVTILE